MSKMLSQLFFLIKICTKIAWATLENKYVNVDDECKSDRKGSEFRRGND